jgi:hypothetical protein
MSSKQSKEYVVCNDWDDTTSYVLVSEDNVLEYLEENIHPETPLDSIHIYQIIDSGLKVTRELKLVKE